MSGSKVKSRGGEEGSDWVAFPSRHEELQGGVGIITNDRKHQNHETVVYRPSCCSSSHRIRGKGGKTTHRLLFRPKPTGRRESPLLSAFGFRNLDRGRRQITRREQWIPCARHRGYVGPDGTAISRPNHPLLRRRHWGRRVQC